MSDVGKLCHAKGSNNLAYKKGGNQLIFKKEWVDTKIRLIAQASQSTIPPGHGECTRSHEVRLSGFGVAEEYGAGFVVSSYYNNQGTIHLKVAYMVVNSVNCMDFPSLPTLSCTVNVRQSLAGKDIFLNIPLYSANTANPDENVYTDLIINVDSNGYLIDVQYEVVHGS